jgi:hypothetical protein
MMLTAPDVESLSLLIEQEIHVNAPLDVTFEALLEQLGPMNETPDGTPLALKIEPWPGGRWFRDLGNNTGHFWGHVQVIKPPTLLELCGPFFMSYPAMNFIQYRLTPEGRGTKLTLAHQASGPVAPEHREGVHKGWEHIISRIRDRAQR